MPNPQRILITGGAGFLGSHIAEAYAEAGAEVIALDNLKTGRAENLAGFKCRFVEGTIENAELLQELAEGCDYIFHMAASISIPESFERPNEAEAINVLGTLNVLEAARKARVRKVVFASSGSVYGSSDRDESTELQAVSPDSPLAITKIAGEHYMAFYSKQYRVPTVSMRLFTVFGPRQNTKLPGVNAIACFADRARRNEPMVIFGDGTQVRGPLYVKDAVAAARILAENGDGVFNVCGEERLSVTSIAYEIIAASGSRSRIIHQQHREGDIERLCGNTTRLRKLGWAPKTSFRDGLEHLLFPR